ncbi:glycosyltransferase family 4 protein [Ottowia thiooxydans]|uniref:glycosyltransferase family 4 protein n=1 Tax=Ottowia thiooxydans TaxID=219182 RepID=UPI00040E1CAB|nr:glycosyltransferase family 4 protein [Ottowia thiooxydans]
MTQRICLSSQIYPPELGGVGVAAHRLACTLLAAGYEVHVVSAHAMTSRTEVTVEHTLHDGIHVHRVCHGGNWRDAAHVLGDLVFNLDEQYDFDLFHGFFLTAVYPCIRAVRQSGRRRPVVASIRGNDALTLINHPLTRAPIVSSLKNASWITSVNAAYLDLVSIDVDVQGRSSVIRNSVKPMPQNAELWRLGDHNRHVVGTVGELRKVKDIPLLVRAYAALPLRYRRQLCLAGYFQDQEEERWTNALISEFAIEPEVNLTGPFPHSEVFDRLRGMHVYVQPSAYEGLPNALLEAASLGIPLVATEVGGMKEILRDGENALVVPHGEPAAMTAAIERILQDDVLAMRLSAGALQLARELSPENENAGWLGLYRNLLSSPEFASSAESDEVAT